MLASVEDIAIIRKTISDTMRVHFFDGKRTAIFGCNLYARPVKDALEENGIIPDAFIDNDKDKQGIPCLGIMTYSPEQYMQKGMENSIIIICSRYYQEMRGQLTTLGMDENQILFIPVSAEKTWLEPTEDNLKKSFESIEKGLSIYKHMREGKNPNCMVFLCPYPGTGDIYVTGCYFNQFLKKNNTKDYIFVVDGKSCSKVAELFFIQNIVTVEKKEMELLLKTYEFFAGEILIKPLLYWGWRTKEYIRGTNYPQINFSFMFRNDALGLTDQTRPEHPPVYDRGYAKTLFEKLHLKKGKTVILAPYAGSFKSEISIDIWKQIEETLRNKGYSVCTNSTGAKEPAIGKSVPIFFPYNQAINVVNYAGYFIGLRSGLCDVISSATAKMVILYESTFSAANMDFFGLKNMGLNDSAVELDYHGQKDFGEQVLKLV